MARYYPASIEMRTPAIVSAMVHVFVLGAAVLNLDFFGKPPPMEPEPVMEHVERRVPMLWAAAAVTAVLFGAAAFWAYRMGGSETAQWSGIASWITKPERTYVPPTEASLLPVSTPAPFVLPEEELGVRTIPLTPDDSVHVIVDLGLAVPNAAPRDSTAVAPRAVDAKV